MTYTFPSSEPAGIIQLLRSTEVKTAKIWGHLSTNQTILTATSDSEILNFRHESLSGPTQKARRE